MIDYTPQELGFIFEKKCRTILSQYSNAIVLKESEVKKRFGAATTSVDIYAEINNNIFLIQCKFEKTTPSISAINHFIEGCRIIHGELTKDSNYNNYNYYYIFMSKKPASKNGGGLEQLNRYHFENIHMGDYDIGNACHQQIHCIELFFTKLYHYVAKIVKEYPIIIDETSIYENEIMMM